MVPHSNFRALVLGISLAGVSLFGQSTGSATTSMSSSPQFPPVGVAPSETLQVNLANIATESGSSNLMPQCSGTLTFYDAGGLVIGDGTSIGFSVAASILSVPLTYPAIGASGQRAMVRVDIKLAPITLPTADNPRTPACTLLSSLEIYDTATGAIHAVVKGNPSHYQERGGH
jgi:hypothetical protein